MEDTSTITQAARDMRPQPGQPSVCHGSVFAHLRTAGMGLPPTTPSTTPEERERVLSRPSRLSCDRCHALPVKYRLEIRWRRGIGSQTRCAVRSKQFRLLQTRCKSSASRPASTVTVIPLLVVLFFRFRLLTRGRKHEAVSINPSLFF